MEEGLAKQLNVKLGNRVTFMGDTGFQRHGQQSAQSGLGKPAAQLLLYLPLRRAGCSAAKLVNSAFAGKNSNGMLTQQPRIPDHQPAGYWRHPQTGERCWIR